MYMLGIEAESVSCFSTFFWNFCRPAAAKTSWRKTWIWHVISKRHWTRRTFCLKKQKLTKKAYTTTKDVYASNLCVWDWPYDAEFSQDLYGTCIYINMYTNTDFLIFYPTSLGSTPKSPNSVWEFTRNTYWSASQKKKGLITGTWILPSFIRMCCDIRGGHMRV